MRCWARYAEPHRRYPPSSTSPRRWPTFEELRDLAARPAGRRAGRLVPRRRLRPGGAGRRERGGSAALAAAEGRGDEVVRLILLTAGHSVGPRRCQRRRCVADVDLAHPRRPAGRYARYAADVEAEYAHVPDDGLAGRSVSGAARVPGLGAGCSSPTGPTPPSTSRPAGTLPPELAALERGEPQA